MTDKPNLSALKELFGRAILARLMNPRGQRPGKHFRVKGSGGGRKGKTNPAGTKLVRSFIRRGKSENTAMRKLYAEMTGHQYGA